MLIAGVRSAGFRHDCGPRTFFSPRLEPHGMRSALGQVRGFSDESTGDVIEFDGYDCDALEINH
jgi:hypothetical protein